MIVAYSCGVESSVIDEDTIAFLFNASPSADVIAEGGTGASKAPRMDADAFASYILEQFKARVAKSSRKPWVEAKEYYYQLLGAWRYRDADYIRALSETAAYPDKLDFDELMNMWLSLPRRERKKARTLITYKIVEYGTEEFLKLITKSEKVQEDAELRDMLLRAAQAFVNKNISAYNLTSALLDMFIYMSLVQIEEDLEANVKSFIAGLFMMERSRKDRLRELVKKYIVDELTAIEKKMGEVKEEEDDIYFEDEDEDPYSIPCDDDCEELDSDYEYLEEDDYDGDP